MIFLICGSAAAARASDLSDEVGMSTTRSTPQNPRAGNITNSFEASTDVAESWSLAVSALVTAEGATAAPPGSAFADRGGMVGSFSAGLEFQPGDNWSLGAMAEVSPKSTQRSGTQLDITTSAGTTSPANALLRATSSSAAGQLTVDYDSAGESDLEWSVAGGVTLTHFETDQRIVALQESNGNVATTAAILLYCQTHTCSKALLHVIGPQPTATLDSGEISLRGTLTFAQDTDVGVSGDYYAYEQDPTQVGYFSVGSAGRMHIVGGSGVPIAPLRYIVGPEVAERFGNFSIRVWAQVGRYVTGAGQTTRVGGIRLEYDFTKSFRMWTTGTGQRDVDSEGAISTSMAATLGAGYKF